MATVKFVEKLKLCIQHLEGFVSSAKSKDDLANLSIESVEILRALLCLLSSLPSLYVSNDDSFHQKASHIFENGIWVIDNIAQFQANNMVPTLEKLHNLHHVLEEFSPELKTVDLHSWVQNFNFKLDQSSEDHLARCLRPITNAMGNILEVLKCFQGAFFMCREAASVCVQEFSIVWPQLKDIIKQLESTTITTHGETGGGNRFISTFCGTVDRLFRISMNALWLLFSFPETEHDEFEVIINLCRIAVQIFVHATGVLNRLTQFFFKDTSKLKALLDGLSQNMQAVHAHCGEMFELKSNSVAIFENVCDQKCSSVDMLKNSTVDTKSTTVFQNSQGAEQETVDFSTKTEETLVKMSDAVISSQSSCDTEGKNINEMQIVPSSTNLCEGTSAVLKGVSEPIVASLQSSIDAESGVRTATVTEVNSASNCSSLPNLWDLEFDSLVPSQKNILKQIMGKYKCHINHFSSYKITKLELLVLCKLCRKTLPVKNINKHIDHPSHQQNLCKKYQDSQKASTVVSTVLKINPKSTLCVDFHDIKFNLLTLSQKKALKKLIMKIRPDSNHFSFVVKTTKSQFLVLCNVCGKTLCTESSKGYSKGGVKHPQNQYKTCELSAAACIATPEISIDKWQFLNFLPEAWYMCSLCAVTLGSSANPSVEHIHSFVHQSKLKESKFQDSVERNISDLVGFAHFFQNLLSKNFASFKVSLKQHVVRSGAKLKAAVNSFWIEKKRDSAKLSFFCHECKWSITWKNTVDYDILSHNHLLGVAAQEEEEVLSNGLVVQNNYPWENFPETIEELQEDLHVLWGKEMVQNLHAELPIIRENEFSSFLDIDYPDSPDCQLDFDSCRDFYPQLLNQFMFEAENSTIPINHSKIFNAAKQYFNRRAKKMPVKTRRKRRDTAKLANFSYVRTKVAPYTKPNINIPRKTELNIKKQL